MRFRKVLLITSPVKTDLGPVRPNLGLGYLAQTLLANGIEYDVLDMLLGYSLQDLRRKIERFKPDLLGISIFSNKYKGAYKAIEYVKRIFPELKVVAGGPHLSSFKEKVLKECRDVDYGIFLEGEHALLELCNGLDLGLIKNLIHRDGSKIISNPVREFIKDLDSLPFPTYHRFELGRYLNEKSISSSRGCPYDCIFCAVKVTNGKEIRLRSPENVVDEMEYWYKKGYRQFSFQDDNFAFNKEAVHGICDEIKRRGMERLLIRCSSIRAERLDREMLLRMKEVGFRIICMGVEVGNDRMLKIIKKGERFADIDRAVKLACEMGFDVQLYFLSGVPQERLSDIGDAIAFALKYPIFYAEWSNTIPYPGTELYDWLVEKNHLLSKPEEYLNHESTAGYSIRADLYTPIFQTPGISLKTRRGIVSLLQKTRKRILRNGVSRALVREGMPRCFSDLVAYCVSTGFISKFLIRYKMRSIADKFRYSLEVNGRERNAN